jgi:hypothetical protein
VGGFFLECGGGFAVDLMIDRQRRQKMRQFDAIRMRYGVFNQKSDGNFHHFDEEWM